MTGSRPLSDREPLGAARGGGDVTAGSDESPESDPRDMALTDAWDDPDMLLPPLPAPVPPEVERIARALRRSEGAPRPQLAAPVAVPGYEILGELGRGGMGVVYHARDLRLPREVALKMVLHGRYASPCEVRRLRSEAEAIARLQHPNIVQVFEVGEVDGVAYCALEYVAGGSLAEREGGAPLPARVAVECVATLCQALTYAHERGILHRDLKPSNVLLTLAGVPKISDFGLAWHEEQASEASRAGAAGRDASLPPWAGTPSYIAPELLRWGARPLQPTVDVYGLGAILYELLTGRPPFHAQSPHDTLLQALCHDPPPPTHLQPNLPRDLDTICLKCLAKQPARRYATAQLLEDDLRRFLEGRPIHARRISSWERLRKWSRRQPALAAFAACLLVAVVVVSLIGWGVAVRERRLARTLEDERNGALRERNDKVLFMQKYFTAAQQLKELADAMAALPDDKLRRELQERRLDIYREAVRDPSEDRVIAREQARMFERVADICRSLKRLDEALAAQRRANQIYGQLLQEEPHHPVAEEDYVVGLDRLGLFLKQNREEAEAQRVLRDGITRAETLLGRTPPSARLHSALGAMLNNLATLVYASPDPAQLAEACAMLRRAIAYQQRAVELDANPMYTVFLRNHYGALAEALLRQGDYTQAAVAAHQLPTFFPQHARDYERAAEFLERCRRLSAEDPHLAADTRRQRAAQYAQEAAHLLAQASRLDDAP